MSSQPLNKYINELQELGNILDVAGKPQKLQIVGETLYWLQGSKQELYSVNLSDSNSKPKRVIIEEKEKEEKEFSPESKEEELLRERQRTRVTGISTYRVRSSDGAVLFTCGTNIFLYYPSSMKPPLRVNDYISEETKKRCFGDVRKPFLCIEHFLSSEISKDVKNNKNIFQFTFVHASNLYIATIIEHNEKEKEFASPLEVNVETVTTFGDELHECGTADYIMQEEFDRYTGHYSTERYIIFSYTDISMLQEVALIDGSSYSGVEKMPYCRVGERNASTVLIIYERESKKYRIVPRDSILAVAPWVEYIPRFGFKNDEAIYFSVLDRKQELYNVLSCPINSLPIINEQDIILIFNSNNNNNNNNNSNNMTVTFTREWNEYIPWAWVDVNPGMPIFFTSNCDILLRHACETNNNTYRHLYKRQHGAELEDWLPLTSGEWNVRPHGIKVLNDSVIFMANADARLGNSLYKVSLENTEASGATQLTRVSPGGEHIYNYTIKHGVLCYVAGTAMTPAELYVSSLKNPNQRYTVNTGWLKSNEEDKSKEITNTFFKELVIPKIVTAMSRRGIPLSGHLFVSPTITPGTPAPLVMYVYGGPHVQLVYENDYDAACKPIFQLLAKKGVSVLVADGQMSNANSLRHHSICKKNMGNFETSDYVDFVEYMTTSPLLPDGFIADPARIAIFGWSYGGYATLLAMSQAANVFKIGLAGAPVGDWTLYDTGYTERYMGELYTSNNDETGKEKIISKAYTRSAIKNFVSGFPDDFNRVFIAHGLLDENVHFSNTCAVINAMVDAGKPLNIIVYPGERHGLRQKKASRHHNDAMIIKTLVEML